MDVLAATAPSLLHEGRTLRRARQRRRLSLDEAAEATRIPKRFLEALEREAPVDTFPAPVYGRAFLREYARYLDLEPDKLVDAFEARNHQIDPPLRALPAVVPPPRRWPGRVVLALAAAGLLFLGVVRLTSSQPFEPSGVSPGSGGTRTVALGGTNAKVQPPPSAPAESHAHTTPPRPNGIRMTLRFNDDCWIRVWRDGQVMIRSRTLLAGQSLVLQAKRTLKMRLGNAGGVVLRVDGKSVHPGSSGEVVELSFAWRHGRIVTV